MHDPLVVAHEVVLPIPVRKWRDKSDPRLTRKRFTDGGSEKFVYSWWRPAGYEAVFRGRRWGLYTFATIWHVEPGGRDSGTVCRHYKAGEAMDSIPAWKIKLNPFLKFHPANPSYGIETSAWVGDTSWKWHVHHWRVQVHLNDRWRRFLLERCEECGRRYPWGYAPVSHQWDSERTRWRDGVVKRSFHSECSSLTTLRRSVEQDADAIRWLAEAWRVGEDIDHKELLHRLHLPKRGQVAIEGWTTTQRIKRALGWVYDTERDGYVRGDEFVSMQQAVTGERTAQ